jgi:hypothetical protein
MSTEPERIVLANSPSQIQAVARDGVIKGTTIPLVMRGAVNIGIWFIVGATTQAFFRNLTENPIYTTYLFIF